MHSTYDLRCVIVIQSITVLDCVIQTNFRCKLYTHYIICNLFNQQLLEVKSKCLNVISNCCSICNLSYTYYIIFFVQNSVISQSQHSVLLHKNIFVYMQSEKCPQLSKRHLNELILYRLSSSVPFKLKATVKFLYIVKAEFNSKKIIIRHKYIRHIEIDWKLLTKIA